MFVLVIVAQEQDRHSGVEAPDVSITFHATEDLALKAVVSDLSDKFGEVIESEAEDQGISVLEAFFADSLDSEDEVKAAMALEGRALVNFIADTLYGPEVDRESLYVYEIKEVV